MTLPAPRTPDPMAAPALRWGVLGTGWIAERFVRSVGRHTRQRFTAVASRDAARAQDFAGRHDIPRAYASYADLVDASDVDVVYVATGHAAHLSCARLALEACKHVLVEKPLGLDAVQAAEIGRLAGERGLFCAEAHALHFEAAEVARCISAGHLDSPLRPPADSVATLRAMDEIRCVCGISFPATASESAPSTVVSPPRKR